MWVLGWTLGSGFLLGLLNMSGLSSWDRLGIFAAALLAGVNAAVAARRDAELVEMWRQWKRRLTRQRHTEIRGEIAVVGAKVDEAAQQILARIDREAELRIGQATSEQEKVARMVEWKKAHEAILEIMALYDNAQTYRKLATDTLGDIGRILWGSAAEANKVEKLLGLPMTIDRDYQDSINAESKLTLIEERAHLYRKQHVEKIGKDKLLMPSVPMSLDT